MRGGFAALMVAVLALAGCTRGDAERLSAPEAVTTGPVAAPEGPVGTAWPSGGAVTATMTSAATADPDPTGVRSGEATPGAALSPEETEPATASATTPAAGAPGATMPAPPTDAELRQARELRGRAADPRANPLVRRVDRACFAHETTRPGCLEYLMQARLGTTIAAASVRCPPGTTCTNIPDPLVPPGCVVERRLYRPDGRIAGHLVTCPDD